MSIAGPDDVLEALEVCVRRKISDDSFEGDTARLVSWVCEGGVTRSCAPLDEGVAITRARPKQLSKDRTDTVDLRLGNNMSFLRFEFLTNDQTSMVMEHSFKHHQLFDQIHVSSLTHQS